MPKISVIMPAYNAEKYIAEAMDSILNQTFGDFEFIILNDCSKDRTEEIILSYTDPRIVYVKNEENMGVARTLNRGLELARGKYIARMDADDISLPERFAKQVSYLDANANIAVLGTNIELFTDEKSLGFREFSHNPELIALDMFFSCGLAHPSVMMRTNVIQSLGGYTPEFNGLEDYELWCRVLKKHKITTLTDFLLRYRIHGNQVTQNPSPRHQELMHILKKRQLTALGVPTHQSQNYLNYCLGKQPANLIETKQLCLFLQNCIAANKKRKLYSPKKMYYYFCNIATNATVALPLKEALIVRQACNLIVLPKLLILKLRKL